MDELNKMFKVNKPYEGNAFVSPMKRVKHSEPRITEIKTKQVKEKLSLEPEKEFKPKSYKVEDVKLPENIQKFDKKAKVYTKDPYSFNEVSLKKDETPVPPTQTASQMILNPTYNSIGKFLGVDTVHDWNKNYDKVYMITEWAKTKVGDNKIKIMRWLSTQARRLPSLGNKNIDNLYIFARMKMLK